MDLTDFDDETEDYKIPLSLSFDELEDELVLHEAELVLYPIDSGGSCD